MQQMSKLARVKVQCCLSQKQRSGWARTPLTVWMVLKADADPLHTSHHLHVLNTLE